MPCTMAARGIRQTPPHTGPAFDDRTDNNPCGKNHVVSAGGVSMVSHSLCLGHLAMKLGLADIKSPVVIS